MAPSRHSYKCLPRSVLLKKALGRERKMPRTNFAPFRFSSSSLERVLSVISPFPHSIYACHEFRDFRYHTTHTHTHSNLRAHGALKARERKGRNASENIFMNFYEHIKKERRDTFSALLSVMCTLVSYVVGPSFLKDLYPPCRSRPTYRL